MAESMATEKLNEAGALAGPEMIITRFFKAPRALVFQAWTDPERLKRWWGPRAFTTPYCRMDLRPGGMFHFRMRSPEGKDYWGKGVYREIAAPERLVYVDSFSDEKGGTVPPDTYGMPSDWPQETLITLLLAEEELGTTLTLNLGVTEELARRQLADQGWNESLDRLAEYLQKIQAK